MIIGLRKNFANFFLWNEIKTRIRNLKWPHQGTTLIIKPCKTIVFQVFIVLSVLHLLRYHLFCIMLTTNSFWLYMRGCMHHLVYPDVDALEYYYFLQSHAWIKIWKMILLCIRYAHFKVLACVLHKSRSRLEKKCRSSAKSREKCSKQRLNYHLMNDIDSKLIYFRFIFRF